VGILLLILDIVFEQVYVLKEHSLDGTQCKPNVITQFGFANLRNSGVSLIGVNPGRLGLKSSTEECMHGTSGYVTLSIKNR
jgi:hypothetical protein